ncbi:MAG: aminotransferase class V-fold PLP-dependent enzyme, partial [Planctomycetota bacterium]
MKRRIYLDHAATRFPKPSIVIETMREYSLAEEAAVGRGAYRSSQNASEMLSQLRREVASWIDADDSNEISFHSGGTEALNTAIFGLLQTGDHVVTTDAEHNSVLRPLHELVRTGRIRWSLIPVSKQGLVDVDDVINAVGESTRLVAMVHGANVNGAVQDIQSVGTTLFQNASSNKPAFLVDAAQTFGYLPLSVDDAKIDLLAAPGHKGGSGPLGTGFLYARQTMHACLRPLLFGGTGSQSESMEMPTDYPAAFEAGNQNVPAAAGWLAGLRSRRGEEAAQAWLQTNATRLTALAEQLHQRLRSIPGVQLIGAVDSPRLPIASVAIEGLPADEAAMILDGEFGIEVRSGMHCAARVHASLGSPPGGTLRISASENTTTE